MSSLSPHRKSGGDGSNLAGERRLVSILFCDVQGSTAMAGRLDPEEWAEIIDEAFDYLIAPVVRYGGTVARLMGDGILAVFGAPITHEDDAERAILAALDIVAGIRPFQEEISQNYRMDFAVRVGINTGMVVVAEIGSDQAAEWTAMGDAVNLAARMEQTAAPGTIQVGEETYRLVAPLFDFEPLGSIAIKGKPEPVPAYRALGAKQQPGRLRGIPGLETPLIGREAEVKDLYQAVGQLRQGRGGIACLLGEAGLGKSRLIEEARKRTMDDGRLNWLAARSISFESNRPYGLFRQYLLESCGVGENEPAALVRQKVHAAIAGSGQPGGQVAEALRAVDLLLAPDEDPQRGAGLEGEALKRELFAEAAGIFSGLAAENPLVIVADDLHWADHASVELLAHLFSLCEDLPILFLCSLRPYRQAAGWLVKQAAEREYPHRYLEIELRPLSNSESNTLIDRLLAIAELPDDLRRSILDKAEGNPFFVEEIVRNLIESGAVVRAEGGLSWQAVRQVEEITIPDSIHALLAARIDRLDSQARQVLQLAAVIGRNFPYAVLREMSDPAVPPDGQLNALERMGLIWEAARLPEREYAFRHELTRDAAYESILHRRRRQYHRMAGEAIERLYPERQESQAHLLAMHFEKALDREHALKYYTLAGKAAARLYANREAIGHYSRGLELAREMGTAEQLTDLYLHLGRAMQDDGQNQGALARYVELEELGAARGDPYMQLAGLIAQATLRSIPSVAFNREEGRALAQRALELARQLDDHAAEARALWNMMLMEVMGAGNLERAVELGEQALAIARQYGSEEEQAYILHDLARAFLDSGQYEQAWPMLADAKRFWRELGNRAMLADSLGVEAAGHMALGEFERAARTAQEGVDIARAIANPWGVAYNQMIAGLAYFQSGQFRASRQAFAEAYKLGGESGFISAQGTAVMVLAWTDGLFGDPQRGAERLQAFAELRADLLTPVDALLAATRAYLLIQAGDRAAAEQVAANLNWTPERGEKDIYFGPLEDIFLGELAYERGEYELALAFSEQPIKELEQSRQLVFLLDLYCLRGKALLRLGRAAEGRQVLERAADQARQAGARRVLWTILLAMLGPDPALKTGEKSAREQEESARGEAHALAQLFVEQIEDEGLRVKFKAQYAEFLHPSEQ
jgi:class 3 adenylate cyclase/tetratricopeptide (TPR) repeat protein